MANIDAMHDMYVKHDELAKLNLEFAKTVHSDHVHEKAAMLGLVEKLANVNRKPLADMAAPIGRIPNKDAEHG